MWVPYRLWLEHQAVTLNLFNPIVKYDDGSHLLVASSHLDTLSEELKRITHWANDKNLRLNTSISIIVGTVRWAFWSPKLSVALFEYTQCESWELLFDYTSG